jgi:hypothetical protein
MAARLNLIVERPYMLDDITVDVQRLSAALPPDDWDPTSHKPTRLVRQPSGVFDMVCYASSDDPEKPELTVDASEPALRESGDTATGAGLTRERSSLCTSLCRWLRERFRKRKDEG